MPSSRPLLPAVSSQSIYIYYYGYRPMKVLNFGGRWGGTAQRMQQVARLVCDGERKIGVLAARAGTTDPLVEIADYL